MKKLIIAIMIVVFAMCSFGASGAKASETSLVDVYGFDFFLMETDPALNSCPSGSCQGYYASQKVVCSMATSEKTFVAMGDCAVIWAEISQYADFRNIESGDRRVIGYINGGSKGICLLSDSMPFWHDHGVYARLSIDLIHNGRPQGPMISPFRFIPPQKTLQDDWYYETRDENGQRVCKFLMRATKETAGLVAWARFGKDVNIYDNSSCVGHL